MARSRKSVFVVAIILAFALVAAACDSSGDDVSTTTAGGTSEATSSTTTTEPPVTSIPPEAVPGTESDSIPADVAAQMRADIGVIILDVEESRGLPFLEVPTITILDEEEFTARVNALLEDELDAEETAHDEALLKLLGMLDADDDLARLYIDLYTEQVAGYYDGDAKEMVVPVSVDGITPLEEIIIAHELAHALTDQHFEFNDAFTTVVEEGIGDDAAAYQALIEGDATYQQFLYLEDMDPEKAAEAALASISMDTSVYDASPQWLQRDLAFPYEQGLVFAGFVIQNDGLKGLDEAYQAPPITTEQILDPNKYVRGEGPAALDPLTVTLDGWDLVSEASWGEWGIRLILLETLTPGNLAQAASGWGNDTYRQFVRGDDTVFVWSYLGESIEDAEEMANALVVHARDTMGAGGAVESGGGLLFAGGSPWVFIDRIDDRIYFVASTDAAAGEEVRTQLGL